MSSCCGGGSPLHWSSTRQPFICRSTAESELVATLEGVAVGESYGEVVAELIGRMLISSVPTQWNGGEGLRSAGSLQGSVPMQGLKETFHPARILEAMRRNDGNPVNLSQILNSRNGGRPGQLTDDISHISRVNSNKWLQMTQSRYNGTYSNFLDRE